MATVIYRTSAALCAIKLGMRAVCVCVWDAGMRAGLSDNPVVYQSQEIKKAIDDQLWANRSYDTYVR